MPDPVHPGLAPDCVKWSQITQYMLGLKLILAVLTVWLTFQQRTQVVLLLALCWIVALGLHYANFRLTRTGFVADRYEMSGRLINHPDARLRLLFHLLINWMFLCLTALVAWLTPLPETATRLAWLTIAGAIAIAFSFNLQHKRVNRRKNLLLTGTIAGTLIFSQLPLL